jgi:hypothetical protein
MIYTHVFNREPKAVPSLLDDKLILPLTKPGVIIFDRIRKRTDK